MKKNDIRKYEDFFPNDLGYLQEGLNSYVFNKGLDEIMELKTFDYIYFSATGSLPPENEYLKLLKVLFNISSYTDIRLWPNRVVGYAGNNQNSKYASIATGLCAFESKMFGFIPVIKSYNFLERMKNSKNLEKDVLNEKRYYGFGRINNPKDERIEFFIKYIKKHKLNINPTLELVFAIEKILNENNIPIKANYASLLTSVAIDSEVSCENLISYNTFSLGFTLNSVFLFTKNKIPEESFLPVSSKKIIYEGDYKIGRKWEDD